MKELIINEQWLVKKILEFIVEMLFLTHLRYVWNRLKYCKDRLVENHLRRSFEYGKTVRNSPQERRNYVLIPYKINDKRSILFLSLLLLILNRFIFYWRNFRVSLYFWWLSNYKITHKICDISIILYIGF